MAEKSSGFASLLEELIERENDALERPNAPSISADLSSMATVKTGTAAPEGEVAAQYLMSAVRDQFERDFVETLSRIEITQPPSIEPDDIARELELHRAGSSTDFDRIRREFAFTNHPDRVDDAMRERAMIRMQIANQLIDDAKSGLPAKPRPDQAGRASR